MRINRAAKWIVRIRLVVVLTAVLAWGVHQGWTACRWCRNEVPTTQWAGLTAAGAVDLPTAMSWLNR